MKGRTLSRLELAILGLVSTGSPCTAYWIRRQFQRSPSSHFSGSAGAVYPAIRRLTKRRMVQWAGQRRGSRESRLYRLTGSGRQAVKAWLMPPLPMEDVTYAHDPIRTRVYSLDILDADERRQFVDDALEQTGRHMAVVRADCEAHRRAGSFLQHLGSRGVLSEMRARIRWLQELREALPRSPAPRRRG